MRGYKNNKKAVRILEQKEWFENLFLFPLASEDTLAWKGFSFPNTLLKIGVYYEESNFQFEVGVAGIDIQLFYIFLYIYAYIYIYIG